MCIVEKFMFVEKEDQQNIKSKAEERPRSVFVTKDLKKNKEKKKYTQLKIKVDIIQ